ncbi:hypothetical protein CO661_32180 [Sinorhizobium fredii]|uniref:Uncharacterized protein n=1 Tax=Rhizobium fredii TaxID=380 RepID=A0A2A6LMY4_RHIFR|nr:hypothetical protein CO661_32180 [Sinorhizobium fredii]
MAQCSPTSLNCSSHEGNRNQYLRLADGKPSGAIDGVTISSALSSVSLRSSRIWSQLHNSRALANERANSLVSRHLQFITRGSERRLNVLVEGHRSIEDSPAAELNSASRVCEDHPDLQTR